MVIIRTGPPLMPSFPSDYRTQSSSTLVLLREVLQAALASGNFAVNQLRSYCPFSGPLATAGSIPIIEAWRNSDQEKRCVCWSGQTTTMPFRSATIIGSCSSSRRCFSTSRSMMLPLASRRFLSCSSKFHFSGGFITAWVASETGAAQTIPSATLLIFAG